ncbi:MAG: HPr family phosphocarrier protein [Clostridia bacterium]|nr:HPr family phosphocarrier protein [Clostridia bacterium]
MQQFSYVIKDKEGIHARPAGLVVAQAKQFAGSVTIENKGKTADLKRIIAVMALCVKSGEEVIVRVDGAGEEAAAAAIEKVFRENL